MSDNEIIAKYVKERYPELLGTLDFKLFVCSNAIANFGNSFAKVFKDSLQKYKKILHC